MVDIDGQVYWRKSVLDFSVVADVMGGSGERVSCEASDRLGCKKSSILKPRSCSLNAILLKSLRLLTLKECVLCEDREGYLDKKI